MARKIVPPTVVIEVEQPAAVNGGLLYPNYQEEFNTLWNFYMKSSPGKRYLRPEHLHELIRIGWTNKAPLAQLFTPSPDRRRFIDISETPILTTNQKFRALNDFMHKTVAEPFKTWKRPYQWVDLDTHITSGFIKRSADRRKLKFAKRVLELLEAEKPAFKQYIRNMYGMPNEPAAFVSALLNDVKQLKMSMMISFNPLDILLPSDFTTGWTSCWATSSAQGNAPTTHARDPYCGIALPVKGDVYPWTKLGRAFLWCSPESVHAGTGYGHFTDAQLRAVVEAMMRPKWVGPQIQRQAMGRFSNAGPHYADNNYMSYWAGTSLDLKQKVEFKLLKPYCLACGNEHNRVSGQTCSSNHKEYTPTVLDA